MLKLHNSLSKFNVMVDSGFTLDLLLKNSVDNKPWNAYLKIDTGDERGT